MPDKRTTLANSSLLVLLLLAVITSLSMGTVQVSPPDVLQALMGNADPMTAFVVNELRLSRSEERRVGKECRSRWPPGYCKKKGRRGRGSPWRWRRPDGGSTRSCAAWLFFFSGRRRHTRCGRDWSSDVCSSDLHRCRWAPFRSHHQMFCRPSWATQTQ